MVMVELDQALSKVAIGANIPNRLFRTVGPHMEDIERQITLGIMLIVGDKGVDLRKKQHIPKSGV